MKQLIMDVLEDMSNDQVNLASEIARETIANIIVATIRSKDKGWYLDCNHSKEQEEEDKKLIESHKTEEWKVKESWVCYYCGKNTYNVDFDYIGSEYNHLGCELELEMGDRREKNWSQKKHEEKVFNQAAFGDSKDLTEAKIEKRGGDRRKGDRRENRGDDVAKALGHMDEDGEFITEGRQEQIKSRGVIKLPKKRVKKKFYEDMGDGHMIAVGKLSEEIVDSQEGKWIYESPDGGITVFRRPFSDYDPKNKEEIDFKTKEPTGRMFTDYPFKDKRDVQIDGC